MVITQELALFVGTILLMIFLMIAFLKKLGTEQSILTT